MRLEEIRHITVIGAGLMGHGIALEFAAAGFPVRIFDSDPAVLERAAEHARRSAALMAEAGRIRRKDIPAVLGRIKAADSIEAAASDADVVVEAVYEDLEIKRKVFAVLDKAAPAHALLLSNSSAFMPSQIAAGVDRPERVAVAHYFDPPHLLPLVELVSGPQTAPETIDTARQLYERIGKRPVVIEKEMPGFVGNRLQGALGREARALVDAGVATSENVDTVVKYGFGRRLALAGPFEVWELIGWDLVSVIGGELWKDISRDSGAAPSRTPSPEPPPYEGNAREQAARTRYSEDMMARVESAASWCGTSALEAANLRERMERTLVEMVRWDAAGGPLPSPSGSLWAREGEGQGVDKRPHPHKKHPGINRVAVIGAGLMGHGIALEFAAAGYEVTFTDRSKELLGSATQRARKGLDLLAEAGRIPAGEVEDVLLRMKPQPGLAEAVRGADLVIEAISENLELKRKVFAELDAAAPAHAILLSNTSTFLPSALASATKRADRVAVAHYFNPPHLLPVVEVVRGPQTSDATIDTVMGLFRDMGKQPALVQKEVLGFIGNRLQFALFREALSLVQQGVISAPDLDHVVKNSFGRRLPSVGVFDRRTLLSKHLASRSGNEVTPTLDNFTDVPPVLLEKVRKGELGTKAGKGFYDWTPESAEALRLRIGRGLVEMAKWDA
ncbi:MAG: 3-hydroxyacyl-CoA dehydrogenase family protein [Dehalococcoidia bacterium]|nr:3-hydroxyacyl-CoA dehydrogenase family protein [Dehalococcoidia bacterium]